MTPDSGTITPRQSPRTAADLLDLVRRSGLVRPLQLEEIVRAGGPNDTPAVAADRLVRAGLLTPFQARLLLQGKWRGFFLGNYKVLEPLAQGGMGHVYLGEHIAMARPVAIKVLSTAWSAETSAVERFQREVRAAAALNHPNIVRSYDAGRAGTLLYLVMEYLEGASLGELVRQRGPLPLTLSVQIVRQVALGLQHAHDCGWVHRDVKPDNVLLTPAGVAKILDLGLARLLAGAGEQLTHRYAEKDILGTADYLAPEQIRAGVEVDGRADIYGLGATFYFLLTGQPPFGNGSPAQKLVGHLIGDLRSVRELRPEVPAALEVVLTRMMARSPQDRYPNAGALLAALDAGARPAALASVPGPSTTTAVQPAPLQPMPRNDSSPEEGERIPVRTAAGRWRRLVTAAVIVAGVVLASAVSAGLLRHRVPTVPDAKARPTAYLSPTEAARHVLESVGVEMTVQSTGTNRSQTMVFLNSEVAYQDAQNFTTVIPLKVLLEYRDVGIADPAAYFPGKRIRVAGTVTLYNGRPQLVVSSATDIRVVAAD